MELIGTPSPAAWCVLGVKGNEVEKEQKKKFMWADCTIMRILPSFLTEKEELMECSTSH